MSNARPSPPDFAIVGAAKCGTTALYTYLGGHYAVAMSSRKEPCFWAPDIPWGDRIETQQEYALLWEQADEGAHKLRGEASTAYIESGKAIPAILATRPDARLIAMVRNPVEIAPARHSEALNRYQEDVRDFEQAWGLQAARRRGQRLPTECSEPRALQYAQVSEIGDQLERFLQWVPAPQRLVILFDDLRRDPDAVYRRTLEFLGLEDDGRGGFAPVYENRILRSTWVTRVHRSMPRRLGPLYPPLRAAAQRIGFSPSAVVNRLNVRRAPRRPLRPEFERELIKAFLPQIEKVEALIRRDLSHWKQPRSST